MQGGAKEYVGATEIELNELLKRFVVRQAKRRDGQRSQGRAGTPQATGHGGQSQDWR
jgi:hypothetical protein